MTDSECRKALATLLGAINQLFSNAHYSPTAAAYELPEDDVLEFNSRVDNLSAACGCSLHEREVD